MSTTIQTVDDFTLLYVNLLHRLKATSLRVSDLCFEPPMLFTEGEPVAIKRLLPYASLDTQLRVRFMVLAILNSLMWLHCFCPATELHISVDSDNDTVIIV